MKLRPARRKKYCKIRVNKPFPILNTDGNNYMYTGYFNGFCVTVNSSKNCINSMGFFGKGNLSRSFPNFNTQKKPNIIRKRQYEARKEVFQSFSETKLETVIIINDTDSENEDYINNLNPALVQTVPIVETLNLSLEEAFFLSNSLNCLNIYNYENKLVEKHSLWNLFALTQPNFIQNYAVYHYFRARNWVVKSGVKFGGDFLLYKQGPPFYHASYVVIIIVISSNKYEQDKNISQRSLEWINLIGLNRLTETAAKEVLICQVIWPAQIRKEEAEKSSDVIKQFSINTILMRRWMAKHERNSKE